MSDEGWSIGVYGASGAVGREILTALEGEDIPISELLPSGGSRTAGSDIPWRGRAAILKTPVDLDEADLDVAILATPDEGAAERRSALIAKGALVIDLSPGGRADTDWPLVWPTLNPERLDRHPGGFAVPCGLASTVAPVATALAECGELREIDAVAMLPASSVGRTGEEDLSSQTLALLNYRLPDRGSLGGVLAFNLLPGTAASEDDRDPGEEELGRELRRLHETLDPIRVHSSCVRVPVFAGLGVVITARYEGDGPTVAGVDGALAGRPDLTLAGPDLAMRDALDSDTILLGPRRVDEDGVVRVFAAADPLHRVAEAVAKLLVKVIAEDLW